MSFRNDLHGSISAAIAEHLQLLDASIQFGPPMGDTQNSAWCRAFLRAVFESKVFQPEEFREAVIRAVRRCGREMHELVLRGREPDHVTSPEALAYVLRNGDISSRLADRIRFDHGETLEQFKSRSDGLIDHIMGQLARV